MDRPIDVTYEEVDRLVHHTVCRFTEKHGGDHDELLGVAHEAFMRAYRTFSPAKAQFTTYLVRCIYHALCDAGRGKGRRLDAQYHAVSLDAEAAEGRSRRDGLTASPDRDWDVEEFCRGMSEDARSIVRMVMDLPGDVLWSAKHSGGRGPNIRAALREYLVFRLGWQHAAVAEAFAEIEYVVSGDTRPARPAAPLDHYLALVRAKKWLAGL